VPKCHIYTFFEHLHGWGLNHFPGQPVPMPDHSFSKEIFPNIQSKCPLVQLEAISSHPITSDVGEETNTCLITTSFQVVLESNKVSPQPPPREQASTCVEVSCQLELTKTEVKLEDLRISI